MKAYTFRKAKLNVVQYAEPTDKESATKLWLDETLRGYVIRYGLQKAVFESSVGGFYLCPSAVSDNFVSNPFNLDVEAISRVSQLLSAVANSTQLSLMGWSLEESRPNECTLKPYACDRDYEHEDLLGIVFDLTSLEVKNDRSEEIYGGSTVKEILSNIRLVLESLNSVDLPVHFLEVCLFGAKYSEESYDEDEDQTCVWEEMGSFSNTSHVVEGLSLISNKNGFEGQGRLNGKYAMVVVV